MLAEEVALGLGKRLIQWHIKSTTKAQQGLYEYDAVSRLREAGRGKCTTSPTTSSAASCGEAFDADEQVVLLIDEVDKADIEFPNDLLVELDRMEFSFTRPTRPSGQNTAPSSSSPATMKRIARRVPAPLLSTSSSLPRPRHHARIIAVHTRTSPKPGTGSAGGVFDVRSIPGLKKNPPPPN